MTNFGKESSEINIISKDTLKNGDTISITLKDSNGNPIADQKVDIIIVSEVVRINSPKKIEYTSANVDVIDERNARVSSESAGLAYIVVK